MARTSPHRNGSSIVPRSPLPDRNAFINGAPLRRNFSLFFIPIARSIGGCRRYVTFVRLPPIAS